MILTILLCLLLAKLRKYRLKPLLRAWPLIPFFCAELFLEVAQISVFLKFYKLIPYAIYIKNGYLLTLLVPILVYKLYYPALWGSGSVLTGTLLNRLVMAANGGKMPVFATFSRWTGYYNDSIQDAIHVTGTSQTKLKFLADYIDTGFAILSIGDLFIHAFTFIILFYTIKTLNVGPAASSPARKGPNWCDIER